MDPGINMAAQEGKQDYEQGRGGLQLTQHLYTAAHALYGEIIIPSRGQKGRTTFSEHSLMKLFRKIVKRHKNR